MKNLSTQTLKGIVAAFTRALVSYSRIGNLRVCRTILQDAENRAKSHVLNDISRNELAQAFKRGTPHRHNTAVSFMEFGRDMAQTELDERKPSVGQGETKCSPDCGRGCTQAEYDAAYKAGTQALCLAIHKSGVGWTLRVWDNLGWHWSLERGTWSLTGKEGRYHCHTTHTAPRGVLQIWETRETVAQAIDAAREAMQTQADNCAEVAGELTQ